MRVNTVGIEQGRSNLPELAARANAGQPTLLTRHGKPWAAIVSPEVLRSTQHGVSFKSLRGSGPGLWEADPAATIAGMRDEWD
ncbi:MAG: type II toxin-antitoxin system Phd/YefM family antitoxin [Burkholderiaceae bacterium]